MALARLLDTTPPRLFTVAACGSLKPAPDGRPRGAYPHLLCSSALPLLVVRSRRTPVHDASGCVDIWLDDIFCGAYGTHGRSRQWRSPQRRTLHQRTAAL